MDDWESTPLGSVAKHSRGYSYSSSELKEAGEPFITLKTFEKGGGFRVDGVKSIEATVPEQFRVSAGSVLIANTDLTRAGDVVGVPAVVPKQFDNAVFSMDATLFIPDVNALDERFLALALGTSESREFMRGNSAGSTVLHLDTSRLDQMPILLPSLKEQKRIAEILDSLDQTIQTTEQLITKHRKIRQGLAHDLLKGPPSGNRAMDDWKWEPLGCLAVIKMGQSPPGSAVSELRDGQPFLQGNAEFGTQSPHPRYQCNQAPKQARTGDLLISVRAPVGAINIADQRYGIGRGLAAIRFKNIHSQFGKHVIKTKARLLDRVAQGTTFTAIGRPDLASLPVPVPPLKKQKLIAEILDSADLAIQENEAELAKLQKLRSGLASDLLSGRVRTVAA